MPSVRDLYNSFNFQDMVLGNSDRKPPQLFKTLFEQDFSYIEKELEKGKNVLEVGCGFGRLLPPLSKYSQAVTGIDFSDLQPSPVEVLAKTLVNVNVRKIEAENMEFDDASFGLVDCPDRNPSGAFSDPSWTFLVGIRRCDLYLGSYFLRLGRNFFQT